MVVCMTNNSTPSITLTDQDKLTLATAAHGAVALIAAAGVKSAGKVAVAGALALASATGPVGHALAEKQKGVKLNGKSTAELADKVLPALTASDLERIRLHLGSLPPESLETRFSREDYLAALGVFLLVFLCLFPVAAPFLLIDDVALALRLSNAVAVGMLFLTGFTFGRQVGRPWRAGFVMVIIGIALVAVAMALGG